MQKNYITADLHIGHKNILKHQPQRLIEMRKMGFGIENDNTDYLLLEHDKWVISIWNKTIKKGDNVYILGDLSFKSSQDTIKILDKLNGDKHLIVGNHDGSSDNLNGYFKSITKIKEVMYKKIGVITDENLQKENVQVVMCHYPMLIWDRKHYGAIQLHGHCHGNIDDFNDNNNDLRIDVGLDGKLSNYKILTIEDIISNFYKKTNDKPFRDFIIEQRENNNNNIIF